LEATLGSLREPRDISRIRTFGTYNLEENQKKMFFPLDNSTERCYIYNITKTDLLEDKNILTQIKERVRKDIDHDIKTSFVIFETQHNNNFCHTVDYTHYIQSEEK
jgi:hypothetical protein